MADAAGVNDQSLYQIATLRPHSKTGRVKSVGPTIRRKLDAAFPNWLEVANEHVSTEPDAPGVSWPHQRFPEAYWAGLDQAERAVLEEAMLDAYDKLMARREQLQGAQATRKQLKPAA